MALSVIFCSVRCVVAFVLIFEERPSASPGGIFRKDLILIYSIRAWLQYSSTAFYLLQCGGR